MGQKFGKATYNPKTRIFINVSPGAIEALWESFNDVADGFGINLCEMQMICHDLASELDLDRPLLNKKVEELFVQMDSDFNALVDAIEFLAAIALSSGMSFRDKLEFVFTCFDFDGAGQLSIDEITLAFRCTLAGLCKLTGETCPSEESLETVAMRAFSFIYKNITAIEGVMSRPTNYKNSVEKLRVLDAIAFCLSDPETVSWLEFFDDPDPIHSETGEESADSAIFFSLRELLLLGRTTHAGVSSTGKTMVPPLLESIDYAPTQQEVDYARDGYYPPVTTAAAAALAGASAMAVDLATDAESRRNPRGEVEPWLTSVASLTPTALANSTTNLSLPDENLSLEWVHGYRGEDCRGNVRYAFSGEIVYPAARLGIVYSQLEHHQRYMTCHANAVVSLALAPDGHIAATGESGLRPSLICWDIISCRPLAILVGMHTVAVTQITFSPSGERIASLGGDPGRTLVVYNWRTGTRVFSGFSNLIGASLGISFVGDGPDSIASCAAGAPFVCFWRREGSKIVHRRGAFGRRARRQPTLSLARCGDVILSGQASGHLYVWHGRNCVQAIRAHRGSLNALHVCVHGVLTGGRDGKIRQWSHALESGPSFDLTELGTNPTVRSVCLSNDGTKLLIGTGGNEIYELSAADGSDALGGPVTSTHFGTSVSGITCHPVKPEYVTCGADCTARIWDITTKNLIRMVKLEAPISCVTYHPNGELLAAGLGISSTADDMCSSQNPKAGGFCILNGADLSISFEARDSLLSLVDCRFSPDGEILAFASEDCSIYLYACAEEYESIGQCRRHASPVRRIDFSADSRWLRSCCDGGQLHFFNANSGQFQSNLSALKDLRWATESCLFGFGVAGAHGAAKRDGASLTACCRAQGADEGPESGGGVLATGDSYGRVRLTRFPSLLAAAQFEWRGHAGVVVSANFNSDESHLLTAGRDDKCIMQWAVVEDVRDAETADDRDEDEASDYAAELRDKEDFRQTSDRETAIDVINERGFAADLKICVQSQILHDKSSQETKCAKDDPSLDAPYVRDPWYCTASKPNRPQNRDISAPTDALSLSRVYGYSCRATRNNAKYSCCGAVIYPCGGTVVRVDLGSGAQSYGTFHAGFEICALAISMDRSILATSDIGVEPKIAVWSTATIEKGPIRVIHGPHLHAITLLGFGDDGAYIASIGADDSHTLTIHDVTSGYLLFSSSTTKLKPMDLKFEKAGSELLVVGVKHALFFKFAAGHAATRHATASFARFGRHGSMQAFLCCAYLPDGTCVIGTADGHLYVMGRGTRELEKSVKAHDGFIYSMDVPVGKTEVIALVTGARDGDIKVWNGVLEMIFKFDNDGAGPVRSVFFSMDFSRVLVGSQAAAQLREFRTSDGAPTSAPLAGGGCAAGEMWALAAHPRLQHVATASDEGTLVIWDIEARDIRTARVSGTMLTGACRSLAFSPDGKLIAACLGGASRHSNLVWARQRRDLFDVNVVTKDGTNKSATGGVRIDGLLVLLHAETGALINEFTDARGWLRDVKFSPDGQVLVAGGTDGNIHVYMADENGGFSQKVMLTLSKGAAIWSVDISLDNRYIQVSDEARTLSYGDLHVGVIVPDPVILQDVKWATWTSPFGWAVLGIHAVHAKSDTGGYLASSVEGKINSTTMSLSCLSRSNSSHVIATGDNHGVLRVLRYPASNCLVAAARVGMAHVGIMRRLVWTTGDSHLITIGGFDRVVCVWRHEPDFADLSASDIASHDYDDAIDADGGRAMAAAVERALINEHPGERIHQNDENPQTASWTSALIPPSNLELEDPGKPELTMRLDCAHGQRSDDIRGFAGYNAKGGVVYACGALGIIYDARTHSQCFHFHHPEGCAPIIDGLSSVTEDVTSALADIVSLAVSFDGHFAASGDQGKFPRVRVWDAMTGNLISVLPRHLRCGVLSLSFSQDCRHLVAIGGDIDHSYALYATRSGEWEDAARISFGCGTRSRVFCTAFVGREAYPCFVGSYDGVELLWPGTCGSVRRSRGRFDGLRCPVVPILCVVRVNVATTDSLNDTAHPHGYSVIPGHERTSAANSKSNLSGCDVAAVTGTSSGALYLWNATQIAEHVPNAHEGPIYAIAAAYKRNMYATAGRDGTIKLWNVHLQHLDVFRLAETTIPLLTPTASSLCFAPCHENKILVIARSGEMCELAILSGAMVLLSEAHARRKKQAAETHGLDVNPKETDIFATSGDDATVRIWSCLHRRCILRALPDVLGGAAARSCSWGPDGARLAVGLGGDAMDRARDGTLVVLHMRDGTSPEVLTEVRKSKAPLIDIKWCHDGRLLFVASEDGRVYIHDAGDGSLRIISAKAPASLTSIDLSADSSYFQVGTRTNDLQFFSADDGTRITSPTLLRDTKWATITVPFGWDVQGCWNYTRRHEDGTSQDKAANSSGPRVVSVHRSSDMSYLAKGCVDGTVAVYNYPTHARGMAMLKVAGHASSIAKVRFTKDGRYLIALGRFNRTITQWSINHPSVSTSTTCSG